MPAGSRWLAAPLPLQTLPVGTRCWHVHASRFRPLAANPSSRGRLALVGTHGMFYAADCIAGALWETVLRDVDPDRDGRVVFPTSHLAGMQAVEIRLRRQGVAMLGLGQPALRRLFNADSAEAAAVAALLRDPCHENTHDEARLLHEDFTRCGIDQMPVLSWPSRQLNTATVYLAYEPPMEESWWEAAGEPLPLDDRQRGHALVRDELARHGFRWIPLATEATPPGPR